MQRRHIVIGGLSGSTKHLDIYIINANIFGEIVTEEETCVSISSTIFI
jgi:hypothetical protein